MKFVCSFLCRFSVIALVAISSSLLTAQEDSGGAKIGTLNVTVYYATNGDPTSAGDRAQTISEATKTSLSATEGLKFTHYRAMGADAKPIFKSYENWAQPLKPADEILIRFETRLEHTENEIPLNLDLWLTRKKVLKSDITLKRGQPLYILGPEWRGGRLIIAVELAPK